MDFIFIYGPPAIGKLTVAKELSKITNYKVFHNHLTLDVAESVFKWGSFEFWKLVRKLRLDIIDAISKSKEKGLIFTYVYNGTVEEDRFIYQIIKIIKKHNGKVVFIQLISDQESLKKRVLQASRRKYSKITSIKVLMNSLKKMTEKPMNQKPHISIDNTKLSAKDTASIIKKFINC